MRFFTKFVVVLVLFVAPVRAGVEFDGTDDQITVSHSASLQPSELTLSFWVYPTAGGGTKRIVEKGTTAWMVRITSPTHVQFLPGFYATTGNIGTNTWTHVAVCAGTAGHQIFTNGVLGFTNSTAYSPTGTSGVSLGGSTDYFVGRLSEVKIYNRVLSASEIAILASSRLKGPQFSGLTHYWPLNDVADGASADAVTFKDRAGSADGTGNDGANNTGLAGRAETYLSYP